MSSQTTAWSISKSNSTSACTILSNILNLRIRMYQLSKSLAITYVDYKQTVIFSDEPCSLLGKYPIININIYSASFSL